jgi:hypothetical protein
MLAWSILIDMSVGIFNKARYAPIYGIESGMDFLFDRRRK